MEIPSCENVPCLELQLMNFQLLTLTTTIDLTINWCNDMTRERNKQASIFELHFQRCQKYGHSLKMGIPKELVADHFAAS